MLSRKKRDAKFLIFQSLYIIAIAILFYKGTDLSLVSVVDASDSMVVVSPEDTVISIALVDSLKLKNAIVDVQNDSIINRSILAQITQRANENSKTPITQIVPKPNLPVPEPPKPDEKVAEKKPDKKPTPVPGQDVTEFSNQPFTNPSSDKKLLVYQNGSLIGVIGPGSTRSLKIRSGGKITYGYSD